MTSSSVNSIPITVSLRLGHATALTPHCGVIHYCGVASLPLGKAKKKFSLPDKGKQPPPCYGALRVSEDTEYSISNT